MIPTMPNMNNVVIHVKNNTSMDLEKCTIEHTGKGGHPIKLGNIKSMEKTNEEMCILTSQEKSDLIFSYTLNGEKYSSIVYNNIIFSDIRPLTINISENNNNLIFNTERISGKDI
ncbi:MULTISPECIES: hypothetical protein [Clostridium]|jgi:hypothetical protein|uniref:Uncharacterized protein n=1 Tax=Clostridium tertium TaxID=1559 RepID=A0A9X3XKK4_9CLOT|nr:MULTISPECIES: hypothetical protein [Clostridium]MBP1868042.1 hypothetical protein [Clostridium tertium]MDB1941727.1 hypothetical protein [Clostridium tertium]MDC4239374.1 hypothetical protein [Clostridium tertium]MDU2683241.1 hypothetical protein [Clostridium sp.]MDY4607014.1 hypothetical protein [Clostridium tertium]